tara:strand:+ start:557 stop:1723 length:1167 start_codon:yes stop_codon:yes gene_type:complete
MKNIYAFKELYRLVAEAVPKDQLREDYKQLENWKYKEFQALRGELEWFLEKNGDKNAKGETLKLRDTDTYNQWYSKYCVQNKQFPKEQGGFVQGLNLLVSYLVFQNSDSVPENVANWKDFKNTLKYDEVEEEINLESLSLEETLIRLYKSFNHTSFQAPHYRKLHQVNEYKLTNHFFQKPQRCSLLGPSGIGKTTIAKWYCNQWANSPKNLLLPIYVNCAEESFTGDLNNHIHLELFPHKSPQEVIEFLNAQDGYRLILDGFDALKAQQKQNLIEYLTGEGESLNYTVLSTVFAFEPYQNVVQSNWGLMGFGAESRKLFLKNALGNKSQCSVEEVQSLIEQSEFLWKHMRSPLYLSYIASIAKTDDGLEKLKTPKNTLELKRLFQSCQ